jgi:ABC-type multidrug transport system fused ATPase/permease subunit
MRRTLISDSPFSLCIAHRLATIAFYDRVLVLDAGNIVEFDTPLNLYDTRGSVFRGMCDAANLNGDRKDKGARRGGTGSARQRVLELGRM